MHEVQVENGEFLQPLGNKVLHLWACSSLKMRH